MRKRHEIQVLRRAHVERDRDAQLARAGSAEPSWPLLSAGATVHSPDSVAHVKLTPALTGLFGPPITDTYGRAPRGRHRRLTRAT